MHNLKISVEVPFDIGEKVKVLISKNPPVYDEDVYIVEDILTVHSTKRGMVKFRVFLTDENKTIRFGHTLLRGDKDTLITLEEYNKLKDSKKPEVDKNSEEKSCGVIGKETCSDCPEQYDCKHH